MANIKTIVKKLMTAGYSENELSVMSEKKLRETFKILKEEIAMSKREENVTVNNEISDTTVETTMNKLVNLVSMYDCFTQYIENYQQQCQAEKTNCKLEKEFVEAAKELGIDANNADIYLLATNTKVVGCKYDSVEAGVQAYIDSHKPSVEVEKEETTMDERTTQEIIKDALTITKIQDEKYVTKEMLCSEYFYITGKEISSKKTRAVLIKALQDVTVANTNEDVSVSMDNNNNVVTENNKEEKEEFDMNKYWTQEVATAILLGKVKGKSVDDLYAGKDYRKFPGIINVMAHNKDKAFINEHILTSIIAETLTGKPLEVKIGNKYVDSNYTQRQIDTIKYIREKFIERYLYKNTNDTDGYRLRADILTWAYRAYGKPTVVFGAYNKYNNKKLVTTYSVTENVLVVKSSGNIYDIHDEDFRKLEAENIVFFG